MNNIVQGKMSFIFAHNQFAVTTEIEKKVVL